MRRVLVAILLLTGVGFAQGTTPNIGLDLPAYASKGWTVKLNGDLSKLDSLLSGVTALPALKVTGCINLNNGQGMVCGTGINFGSAGFGVNGMTIGPLTISSSGSIGTENGLSISPTGAGGFSTVDSATNYTINGDQIAFLNLAGVATGAQLPAPGASTFGGVKAKTCTGTDKVSALGTDGILVCSGDQTGSGGTGITTLNGAVGTTQTFVNGANIAVTTNTGTGAHTFAVTGLATVATAGTYTSLTGKPTLPATLANATHKWLNSFDSTTGLYTQTQPDYADLTGTPTIPTSSDWPGNGACGANRFVTALNDGAVSTCTQPSSSSLSDAAYVNTRQMVFKQYFDDDSLHIANRLGRTIVIQEIYCESDAGNPTIMLQNGANNILAASLTCSPSGASSTTFSGSYNQVAATGHINYVTTTADAAKYVTVTVKYQ